MNGKTCKTNIFLANCISIFHSMIICFILLAPFLDIPSLLILHITFSVSLLVHWWGNSNVCSLSVIESKLRGLNYTESFTHKFIAPVYDISKTTWSRLCTITVIVLMIISLYFLVNSDKWCNALHCFRKLRNDSSVKTLNFFKRVKVYASCFHLLFV